MDRQTDTDRFQLTHRIGAAVVCSFDRRPTMPNVRQVVRLSVFSLYMAPIQLPGRRQMCERKKDTFLCAQLLIVLNHSTICTYKG